MFFNKSISARQTPDGKAWVDRGGAPCVPCRRESTTWPFVSPLPLARSVILRCCSMVTRSRVCEPDWKCSLRAVWSRFSGRGDFEEVESLKVFIKFFCGEAFL
jgi:hypothetical protein